MSLREVAALVQYDPETGRVSAGDRVLGTRHSRGYINIKIGGMSALAHRVAWFKTYGTEPKLIDHINRDKQDNRIANLRAATPSQNLCNRGLQSNNTSGCTGVAKDTHGNKWQAYIKRHGRRVHLGIFDTMEEAVAARRRAVPLFFGEFAPQ